MYSDKSITHPLYFMFDIGRNQHMWSLYETNNIPILILDMCILVRR